MLLKLPDTLLLETEEDVRALRDFLDAFLRLTTRNAMPPPNAQKARTATLPQKAQSSSPIGKKTVEPFFLAALQSLGGAGTSEEVYHKFVELGFEYGAKKPREAISTYLRQRGKFVRLPPDEYGVTRWAIKEEAKQE